MKRKRQQILKEESMHVADGEKASASASELFPDIYHVLDSVRMEPSLGDPLGRERYNYLLSIVNPSAEVGDQKALHTLFMQLARAASRIDATYHSSLLNNLFGMCIWFFEVSTRLALLKLISQAVTIINNKISGELIGMDPQRQSQIDQALIDLDTTDKKSLLEANAMFAVSMAACKAGAAEKEMPLYTYIADLSGNSNPEMPYPVIPIISGGKHAANNLAAQEIMIIPYQASNIMKAIQIGVKTYHHLKDIISEKHGPTGCRIGKDSGLAPNISSISEGLDLVMEAIGRLQYDKEILPALNISATDFCVAKKYDMDFKSPSKSGQPQNFKTGQEMIQMYTQLCEEYKILSITQPFDKDGWDNTKELTGLKCCQVSGDDLLMSNPELVERTIKESTCNALVLKVNQVGTVTEAIEVVKQAKVADWQVMVSHGSGETDDIFISDFAVGVGASQINTGAPCGEEHMSKYNQLLEIEKCLKEKLST